MLVVLIGKGKMHKITLPRAAVGNYWLSDNTGSRENKLINIEGKEGNWQISSNNECKIINPKYTKLIDNRAKIGSNNEYVLDKIVLKENTRYIVLLGNLEEKFILYCLPLYEKKTYHLDIRNTSEITIGKNQNN